MASSEDGDANEAVERTPPKKRLSAGERLAAAKAAKAARKKASRGKDAEELEDKVVKQAAQAGQWAQQNQRLIWLSIVSAAALIALALGLNAYSGKVAAAASGDLWDATMTLAAPIVAEGETAPEGVEETFESRAARDAATLERLRAVAEEHASAPIVPWAQLGIASLLLRTGEIEPAREAFISSLRESGDDPDVAWRATEGIAFTYEAEEDWDQASARFEELRQLRGDQFELIAEYHLARMDLAKGDEVAGKERLRGLLDRFQQEDAPEIEYIRLQAERRLRAIDSSLVPASAPDLEQIREMLRQQGGAAGLGL